VKYDRQWLSVSRRLLIALAAPIAVIALWTAAMQVPHNVLELPRTTLPARLLVSAFPQGWAFFTRSPEEEQWEVFTDTSPPRKLDRAPYSEPHNSFGLDRAVRKQATELADLVGTIPDTEWRACSSDADCVNHAGPAKTIKNSMPDPSLCGTIVIVGSNIVPWGYRKVRTGSFQNTRSVRVEVQCSQ
jgi:antimicrobial peptide system SdpA family protein